MSFISLGSRGSDAPTFFEMIAAERLMPSLKSAVGYALSVYGQSSATCRRMLGSEDELFFLISVLIEYTSLQNHDGSFSENVYGLRRCSRAGKRMSSRQKRFSLIVLTLLPFLKAKLHQLHINVVQQRQRGRHQYAEERQGWWSLIKEKKFSLFVHRLFTSCYPWIHASWELTQFAYQLLYLLNLTPYYSPELHLLGLKVVRMSPNEQATGQAAKSRKKSQFLEKIRNSDMDIVSKSLLLNIYRVAYFSSEHSRTMIIAIVFGFKFLEWWYTSAEQKLGARAPLPVPPPPPPMPPAKDGCAIPTDPTLCPLCRRVRKNPTMIPKSGFVFCYSCIYRHVETEGTCPISFVQTDGGDLRRLFHDT